MEPLSFRAVVKEIKFLEDGGSRIVLESSDSDHETIKNLSDYRALVLGFVALEPAKLDEAAEGS